MTLNTSSATPPQTLNLVINTKGLVVNDFSGATRGGKITTLGDHVTPETQELFQLALRTKVVVQNLRIDFMWSPTPTPFLVTFTPSHLTGNIHILGHLIPPGANPNAAIDQNEAHTVKGLFLQLDALSSKKSTEDLSIDKDFREESRKRIQELGRNLSPFDTKKIFVGENICFDLKRLVKQHTRIFSLQCNTQETGKKFLPPQLPEEIPFALFGDLNSLKMILDNLLTNAVKYTSAQGSVKLAVELIDDPDDPQGIIVLFRVTDSGKGIKPKDKQRVFAMGDRLSAQEGSVEGQGVGLSAAKEVADKLGWTLDFRANEDGPGTTFFVTARFKKTATLIKESSPIPFIKIPRVEKKRSEIKILFIEDEKTSHLMFKALMRRLGVTKDNLLIATLFEDALARCVDPSIDMIITDHQLWEGASGETILQTRRAEEQKGGMSPIPCILCSADPMDQEACHAFGGTQAVMKPYNKALFEDLLKQYFVDPKD